MLRAIVLAAAAAAAAAARKNEVRDAESAAPNKIGRWAGPPARRAVRVSAVTPCPVGCVAQCSVAVFSLSPARPPGRPTRATAALDRATRALTAPPPPLLHTHTAHPSAQVKRVPGRAYVVKSPLPSTYVDVAALPA